MLKAVGGYDDKLEQKIQTHILFLPRIVAHYCDDNIVNVEGQCEHATKHSSILQRPGFSEDSVDVDSPRVAFYYHEDK